MRFMYFLCICDNNLLEILGIYVIGSYITKYFTKFNLNATEIAQSKLIL